MLAIIPLQKEREKLLFRCSLSNREVGEGESKVLPSPGEEGQKENKNLMPMGVPKGVNNTCIEKKAKREHDPYGGQRGGGRVLTPVPLVAMGRHVLSHMDGSWGRTLPVA